MAMIVLRSALLLLLACYCTATNECTSCVDPKNFIVYPSNVECLADYISPNADIRETVIHFKLDPSESELLLQVPIETPESAIVITLGTNSTALDKGILRMQLGLFDSDDNRNSFYIVDSSLYLIYPPCDPFEAIPGDNRLVSSGTRAASTFKFTFLPWDRMGYCATAQDEGYLSVGKFNEQLHGPLYLQIKSQYRGEDFYINHISIKSI